MLLKLSTFKFLLVYLRFYFKLLVQAVLDTLLRGLVELFQIPLVDYMYEFMYNPFVGKTLYLSWV